MEQLPTATTSSSSSSSSFASPAAPAQPLTEHRSLFDPQRLDILLKRWKKDLAHSISEETKAISERKKTLKRLIRTCDGLAPYVNDDPRISAVYAEKNSEKVELQKELTKAKLNTDADGYRLCAVDMMLDADRLAKDDYERDRKRKRETSNNKQRKRREPRHRDGQQQPPPLASISPSRTSTGGTYNGHNPVNFSPWIKDGNIHGVKIDFGGRPGTRPLFFAINNKSQTIKPGPVSSRRSFNVTPLQKTKQDGLIPKDAPAAIWPPRTNMPMHFEFDNVKFDDIAHTVFVWPHCPGKSVCTNINTVTYDTATGEYSIEPEDTIIISDLSTFNDSEKGVAITLDKNRHQTVPICNCQKGKASNKAKRFVAIFFITKDGRVGATTLRPYCGTN